MSPYERLSGSGIASVWKYTASPPISRIGTLLARAAASSRSASATMSESGVAAGSTLDTLHQLDPLGADVDQVSAQDAVVRLAARVHADRPAELPLSARLVDVPVHRQQRLPLLDHATHRRRTDRAAQHVARRYGRAQVHVEDRRGVEPGVVRRDVDHEDGAPR